MPKRPAETAHRDSTSNGPKADDPAYSAFFLIGPTAVGKSAVAQWIAEREGWEIVSADSMLVYKGMDVGTAKPLRSERGRVRYWGLDLVSPDSAFSVGDYIASAETAFRTAAEAGRTLLVVGGTGLYVKCLNFRKRIAAFARRPKRCSPHKVSPVFKMYCERTTPSGLNGLRTRTTRDASSARSNSRISERRTHGHGQRCRPCHWSDCAWSRIFSVSA